MSSTLWQTTFPWWIFVVRGAIVYLSVLLLLRLGGKRQIGQMGTGEFVAILLISNAVQNAMNGGDNSITGGIILAAVIILLSVALAYLTYRSKRLANLLEGTPTLLIHRGAVIQSNLERELMNLSELKTILRRQGIHDLQEVNQAILESDGQVSVIKQTEVTTSTPKV